MRDRDEGRGRGTGTGSGDGDLCEGAGEEGGGEALALDVELEGRDALRVPRHLRVCVRGRGRVCLRAKAWCVGGYVMQAGDAGIKRYGGT